jgi:hypothetical protein
MAVTEYHRTSPNITEHQGLMKGENGGFEKAHWPQPLTNASAASARSKTHGQNYCRSVPYFKKCKETAAQKAGTTPLEARTV